MKKLVFVFLAVLSVIGGPLFAGGAKESKAASGQKSYTIKIGHGHATTHPNHVGYIAFKEFVEKETNGRMKVDVFPSNQIGNEEEMLDQLKIGTLQFTISGRFQQTAPKLEAFGLPFLFRVLFRDYKHVEQVLMGPIGQEYAKPAEEKGLKILGYTHSGFRQITNNKRPITKPEDLKGLKMRTPPIEAILQTMTAIGANPTPIPFPELYMALKTGVVDGQENPFVNIYTGKFHEVQKYLTECNYIYITRCYWVGLKWYESLDAADKALIDKAADLSIDKINRMTAEGETDMKNKLKTAGMQIYTLSSEELKKFQGMVQPVYDWAVKSGYITMDVIQKIQKTGL